MALVHDRIRVMYVLRPSTIGVKPVVCVRAAPLSLSSATRLLGDQMKEYLLVARLAKLFLSVVAAAAWRLLRVLPA
jgi:hypothetical protein